MREGYNIWWLDGKEAPPIGHKANEVHGDSVRIHMYSDARTLRKAPNVNIQLSELQRSTEPKYGSKECSASWSI